MTDHTTTLHAVVLGKVQGVFYRAWTRDMAASLGLSGWVRNLPDGAVEVLARGEAEVVARLHGLLAEGPPLSRVAEVRLLPPGEPEDETPAAPGFTVRR
jgi:acylphosphatase